MRVLAFFLTCTSILGCSSGSWAVAPARDSASIDTDRQAIESALERWVNAYEKGEPDAVADLFTEDAIYAANTGEVLTGREGIRSGVTAWMRGSSRVGQQRATAALDLERRVLRFKSNGALAYDLARFTISMTPPGCAIDAGHALVVLEKQSDGRWLIDALTVNRDQTAPANSCHRQ